MRKRDPSAATVQLQHPDTGEETWAWVCVCGCPPIPGDMCVLQVNDDEPGDGWSKGDLVYAHLSCVAPRMQPLDPKDPPRG